MASESSRADEAARTAPLGGEAGPAAPTPAPADSGEPTLGAPSLSELVRSRGGALAWRQDRRYRIDGMIGAGANGHVFSVHDWDLDRPVAVKLLTASTTSEEFAGFIAEARVTASLQHPNVPPIHDIALDQNGRAYFTMKRIDGRSLGVAIEESTPERRDPSIASANHVVSIAIGACSALAYAHHHGIVHQDVKPDNIMLGRFGEVLLIDWGSAKRDDDPARGLYGTPLYMSPEQARGSHADRRSDVYCLGATLFHTLLLRLPTPIDDEQTFFASKRSGDIQPPSAAERRMAPPALLAIALKALSADPAGRYADASAMLKDLQDYQAGLAVSARHDSLLERLARWYRRNRRLFWVVAASALALSLLGGLYALEKAKERARWNLVYEQDFTRATMADLGSAWSGSFMPYGKDFKPIALDSANFLLDGQGLTVRGGAGYTDLAFQGDLMGNIRVEWDYRCDTSALNYNCFIGGADRLAGYAIHIGGWDNPNYVALTRGPTYEIIDSNYMDEPLVVGRVFHFILEQEDGHLRLTVDRQRVLDVQNPSEVYGDRSNIFGFDCVGMANLRILGVKVFHKPLPRRISPLAVGDKLLQIGDYPRAASAYLDVVRSYPDGELTAPASFRYAVCRLRLGDERACGLLERFIVDHSSDPAVPYALLELVRAKRKLGDRPALAQLYENCARWKGEPVLTQVLAEMADEHRAELRPRPVTRVGEAEWPPDTPDRIMATIAELRRWGQRYGIEWWRNSYAFEAGEVLLNQGRHDDILGVYPRRSQAYLDALLRSSRFEEALAIAPPGSGYRALALMHLGRQAEVLTSGPYPEWQVSEIRLDAGGLDDLLAHPDQLTSVRPRLLVLAGRYQEVLEQYPEDQEAVPAALTGLGRADEIPARVTVPRPIQTMLVDTRRYDELIARHPLAYEELYRAALHLWIEGEHERARGLLRDLEGSSVSPTLEAMTVSRLIFPGLLRVLAGESSDLHALYDAEIAELERTGRKTQWHLLSFLVGNIDEAAFRAQPDRYLVEERLLFARALAADLRGQREAARDVYRRVAELPYLKYGTANFDLDFVRWRAAALAVP